MPFACGTVGPTNFASHCVCRQLFTIAHALSSPTTGYPSIRHNELRDITADLLKELCSNVTVEPPLQSLTGEMLSMRTSIRGAGYPSIRHNELRDITADLLKELCSNVTVEPPLQSLTGEMLSMRTSILGD